MQPMSELDRGPTGATTYADRGLEGLDGGGTDDLSPKTLARELCLSKALLVMTVMAVALFAQDALTGLLQHVGAGDVRGTVELPPEESAVVTNSIIISGWAADIAAPSGTGVSAVRIALDADPDQDGVPVAAAYGWERPDIAALLGAARFQPSGFALTWDTTGVRPGRHTLYIQARSACGWTGSTRTVLVAGPRITSTSGTTATPATSPSPPGAALTPASVGPVP